MQYILLLANGLSKSGHLIIIELVIFICTSLQLKHLVTLLGRPIFGGHQIVLGVNMECISLMMTCIRETFVLRKVMLCERTCLMGGHVWLECNIFWMAYLSG